MLIELIRKYIKIMYSDRSFYILPHDDEEAVVEVEVVQVVT
jgi:hypothetical protein